MKKDREVESHPSYGVIGWNVISCGGKGATLFGSEMTHHQFVSIRIKRAERHRNLSRDWYHSTQEVIEVAMTQAQFAQFITTPNQGDQGVCTIAWTEKDGQMPEPDVSPRHEKFREEVDEKIAEVTQTVASAINDASKILGTRGAPRKADVFVIKEQLEKIKRELASNMPFLKEQMQRHMDGFVKDAKIEIEGYLEHRIRRAGLAALQSEGSGPRLLEEDSHEQTR